MLKRIARRILRQELLDRDAQTERLQSVLDMTRGELAHTRQLDRLTVEDAPSKCACYCLTRNIYHKVVPSMNSLLANSDVERVYLVIEDDDVGFALPDRVECVNASRQRFFYPYGPNYNCRWTYMVMMRTAMCHIFPNLDRVLTLDADTLVQADISALWDTPIGNAYVAAAFEPERSRAYRSDYYNMGVALWNLSKLRDGKADQIIRTLNRTQYTYCEQDCVNELCRGYIAELSPEYNASKYTSLERGARIRHFAAESQWFDRQDVQNWITRN